MPISITSNAAATNAQQNITQRHENISRVTEQLSSGKRLSSAADDPASMAIQAGLNVTVASLRTAQNNAAQGLATLQIAEGAMGEINDLLTRMKTLAIQARSAQTSSAERAIIDTEYQLLLAEVDRISGDTEFNGTPLLSGSTTSVADVNNLGGSNLLANGLGNFQFRDNFGDGLVSIAYDASTQTMTATNLETNASQSVSIPSTAIDSGQTETVRFGAIGLTLEMDDTFNKAANLAGVNAASVIGGTGTIEAGTLALTGAVIDPTTPFNFGDIDSTAISMNVTVPGASVFSLTLNGTVFTSAGVDLSTTGTKAVTLADGNGNSLSFSLNALTAFSGAETASINLLEAGQLVGATSTPATTSTFEFQVGTSTSGSDKVSITVNELSATSLGLNTTSLISLIGVTSAISAIDAATDTLSSQRAAMGAAQQRLEFASSNIALALENNISASSNLTDVDISLAITQLASEQALMEASINMLSRANTQPELLLQLISR